jgi:hypothetical protein
MEPKSYFRKATLAYCLFPKWSTYAILKIKLVAVQYKTQSTVSIVPPRFEWVSNDLKYITRPHVFEMKGWSDNENNFCYKMSLMFQFDIKTSKLKRITNGESRTFL